MKPLISKPNLRNQQRVDAHIDVTITTPDDSSAQSHTVNLSRSGTLLSCDRATARLLLPKLVSPAPGNWVPVSTRLSVATAAGQSVDIEADGHIIHMRRVACDEFHVGIQFGDFKDSGRDELYQYVSRLLAKTP